MTVIGGQSTVTTGTTSIAPALPTGILDGDLLVACVAFAEATNTPPTTPSGWTRRVLSTGGTGTFGADTGPRGVAIYTRDALGTAGESGTVTFTGAGSATGRALAGSVYRVAKTAQSSTWDVAAFSGSDSTSGTAFSVPLTPTSGTPQSVEGDLLLFASGIVPNAATHTNRTITWGSIAGSSAVASQPQSLAATGGNTVRYATSAVTHATGLAATTGTPTAASTLSVAGAGAGAMLRIHEVTVTNNPPSVSVAADDSTPDGGQAITLTATVSDSDGTIASEGWSHNAPAGTVSTSGRTLTFTAPYGRNPGSYTFTYSATDNNGATSTGQATVTVARWLTWTKMSDGTVRAVSRKRPAAPTVGNPSLNLSVVNGDGQTTLNWSITPNGANVSGSYQGRDGTSATGGGPWEVSSPTAGLSGSRTFTNLLNNTNYTLHVTPVVDGVKRTDLTATIVGRPAGTVVTPGLPTYPGFTLSYELDTTQNGPWWTWATGREHISKGYCGATGTEHIEFDSTNGVQIKMRKRTSPITVGGFSLPYDTAEGRLNGQQAATVPNYFRLRAVWQITAFHVGLFPAFSWFRPYNGGEGEIDVWESFGGHIGTSQAINKVTGISTPYDSNQQNYVIKVDPTKVGETDLSILLTDHVYEFEKIPNRWRFWIDGVLITEHTRGGTNGFGGQNMSVANWDRCFEQAAQRWYMRYTGQIGDDPAKANPTGNAGEPPSDFAGSDMRLKELAFWSWDG